MLSIPDFKVTELMHKNYAPFVRTADKCITAFLRFLTAKTKSTATGFKEKIIHLRRKGELPEWSIGADSKSVEPPSGSGGSNPSLSAGYVDFQYVSQQLGNI